MSFMSRCLLAVAGALFAGGVSADWIAQSNENAMLVLRAQAVFEPEWISRAGLGEFDGDVIDLKAGYDERENASDHALLAALNKRLGVKQDPRVRQDLKILAQSVEDEIEARRIANKYLLPYYNLHGYLFDSFNALLDPRNDKARYASALERLRKYNGTYQGYTPIAELARARSSERFGVKGLLGPYRVELETDLADAPRYISGIRDLFDQAGIKGWQQDFALLEQQLADYTAWLQAQMLPRARSDSRLPAEAYANNLKSFGVRASPEQLIEEAQYSYQLLRSQMSALARRIAEQRGWDDKGLIPVIRRLKQEQIPQDRILAVYQDKLARIEDIIRREDLITLPERAASIRLATEAESAAIPASFMSPPQLINNTGQYGEFVLVQTNPALEGAAVMDDWSYDGITWTLTIHEARPGHELQFASLVENGTSLARALFAFNSANVEGWGLYSESVMQEYLPLEAQLFNLYTRAWRAARMFLDPMVNTGQLKPDQVVSFLMDELAVSRPMASSEADRYAFRAPGQATSYYYGYMSIMRLRTEVEVVLGDRFNPREFHDFIMKQGLLPPDLLRDAVLKKFANNVSAAQNN